MSAKNYITPQGFSLLKAEYLELFQKERPKVVETVSWAASNGDRSENADYLYGKKRLREIDKRLKFLGDRLDSSEVVDPKKITSDKIVFGATVTYSDEDGKFYHYQIVGEDEFDVKAGRISWKSPLAMSLLGKKVGDEVILKKPKGNEEVFYIEKIEFM
ncbi:MAG: transcription elongation factor GreB [Deltaproteobacteria bacterium]|nr:transcription elongation factor GreB [Deltaproteobacteria bacterium]